MYIGYQGDVVNRLALKSRLKNNVQRKVVNFKRLA